MQRRCIICGKEPCGYYMYPRTLTEARKWQDWANLYSFNVPAGTLRKHGCVCRKHLEVAEGVVNSEDEDIEDEVKERNVGGMPPNNISSNDLVDQQEKQPSVGFIGSDPNQRQHFSLCCCPKSEVTRSKLQKHSRRKQNGAAKVCARPAEEQQQPNVKVSYCPGTTQIPRPPFQYNPVQSVKYNAAPAWYINQSNQQHPPPQQSWNQSHQASETGTGISAFTGQSSRYSQPAGVSISDCPCGAQCPLLDKQYGKIRSQDQQQQQPELVQQQSQSCQCYINVPKRDKTFQCPSQVSRAAKRRQQANNQVIACDPMPETCECGTTTSRNIVNQPTICIPANLLDQWTALASQARSENRRPSKSRKKETKIRKNPNSVNVLIMGAYGQEDEAEECEEICPETFQPSPLTEICYLESDLTGKNERAIFPDVDLLNYSVCRAPTSDPKTDEEESYVNDNENCADVLVLGKGLKDIDPCPCNCQHCLLNMDQSNCPNHVKPVQQKDELATSSLPQQLVDGNWQQDPQAMANYNQVIAEQKARINELENLLTQHNILQETIQSKVDQLQCNVQASESKVTSGYPLSDLEKAAVSATSDYQPKKRERKNPK